MAKAKTTKKKTTAKTKTKKVEKVVEVLDVPKTEPDPSLWRENGFATEKAYRKFLQPNS